MKRQIYCADVTVPTGGTGNWGAPTDSAGGEVLKHAWAQLGSVPCMRIPNSGGHCTDKRLLVEALFLLEIMMPIWPKCCSEATELLDPTMQVG
ncbi:hypothetical protein SUGI_1086420 [Cryptomeria japonica]|nr:hypothetical protein SUGI_1086420 [Cryptomeria japonica]